MDAKPLLSLDDVTCTRGGVAIASRIGLTLMPGQALILRGPNGSGKTTLLRTIAGLQPAATGRITVAPDAIAYAAHADGLKGMLSVAENLSFWAGLFGTNDIAPALDAFNLVDLKDRLAQTLSAGQKRRLGLARLLVTGRPIWALDEPTVSLDVASVALFADAVRAHLAGGGAALVATHIDLGLQADTLDLTAFRPTSVETPAFDEALL
jgi:heme exporter protein A